MFDSYFSFAIIMQFDLCLFHCSGFANIAVEIAKRLSPPKRWTKEINCHFSTMNSIALKFAGFALIGPIGAED